MRADGVSSGSPNIIEHVLEHIISRHIQHVRSIFNVKNFAHSGVLQPLFLLRTHRMHRKARRQSGRRNRRGSPAKKLPVEDEHSPSSAAQPNVSYVFETSSGIRKWVVCCHFESHGTLTLASGQVTHEGYKCLWCGKDCGREATYSVSRSCFSNYSSPSHCVDVVVHR